MSTSAIPMYVEDVDERTGSALAGTRTSSASVAPSPTKEKPNTSKSRKEKTSGRSNSSSPHTNGLTDSDSTVHPNVASKREKELSKSRKEKELKQRLREQEREREAAHRDRERERERERERRERAKERERASSKKVTVTTRPQPRHSKTTPPVLHSQSTGYRRPTNVAEDSSLVYGVPTLSTPAVPASRPRASTHRPTSYYGPGSRPPAANAQWYASHHAASPVPTSYPPQTWATAGSVPYPVQASPLQPHPTDYFPPSTPTSYAQPNQHLLQRFQQRPSSAMGHRPNSYNSYPPEDYGVEGDIPLSRHPSLTQRNEEDRRRMPPPPPPRPMSAAPIRQAVRPPPPLPILSSRYDDEDLLGGDPSMYQEIVPRAYDYEIPMLQSRSRPRRGSISYDLPTYSVQPAATTGRRHSYYGSGSSGGGTTLEDKIRQASEYQEGVSGGPPLPLTSETLRKASKRSGGGSSRSTRSSASRDDSDYRRSNTTRTTRSSSDEDITIKVTGSAVLKVGGAEIQCQDGGEININRPGGARLGGSDKGSSVHFDDRRSRIERLPTRTRATSQAGSWSRTGADAYLRPGGFI